jgi:hypothetical protein
MKKEKKKKNRNETNCLSNQPGARDHIDPFFFMGIPCGGLTRPLFLVRTAQILARHIRLVADCQLHL